jgi:hypothetical protein
MIVLDLIVLYVLTDIGCNSLNFKPGRAIDYSRDE